MSTDGKIIDGLRPIPITNKLTQPFWDSARRQQLSIQRCRACRRYFHPPVHQCFSCESRDLAFEEVSGNGTVYTFTRFHSTSLEAFEHALPFLVVQIELEEQSWLLMHANMPDEDPFEVGIGTPVTVTFIELSDNVTLPEFVIRR